MAEEWFYTNNGQQMGPVTVDVLRDMAAGGGLQPSDLVWTDGMSAWVPATAARGLFPASAPPGAADVPEVKPAAPECLAQHQPVARVRERRFDRRPVPAGLGTGTKVLIGLGIAGILGLMLVAAVGFVAAIMAETNAQMQQQQRFNRGRPVGGPQGGFNGGVPVNPMPPPPNPKVAPVGEKSYVVKLTVDNQTDGRVVTFAKGQQVTIKVTTTNFVKDEDDLIDVDLYVYDSRGVLVAFDDGPDKDCFATFPAELGGNYTIVLFLCNGAKATCKVDY
jgi:hypothetical protein